MPSLIERHQLLSGLYGAIAGAVLAALATIGAIVWGSSFDKIDRLVEKRPNLLSLPQELRSALTIASGNKVLTNVSVAQVHLLNREALQKDLGPLTLRFQFTIDGRQVAAARPLLSTLAAPGTHGTDGIKQTRSADRISTVDFDIDVFRATPASERYVGFFIFEGDTVPDVDVSVVRGKDVRVVSNRFLFDALVPLTKLLVSMALVVAGLIWFGWFMTKLDKKKALARFGEAVDRELRGESAEVRATVIALFEQEQQQRPTATRVRPGS